jgi:hypothetical protein
MWATDFSFRLPRAETSTHFDRMKVWLGILAFTCAVGEGFSQVATSANYALTIFSTDAGGGRGSSANYTNDLAVATIAVRQSTVFPAFPTLNLLGYVAGMNNPPTAVDDVRSHPFGASMEVNTSILLRNDADPDEDPLQVYAVQETSDAHGVVSLARGRVQYTPPANFSGLDRFKYVELDANGDVDEAFVTMVVAPAATNQTINTVFTQKLPNGMLFLRLRGESNRVEYRFETATDLVLQDWTTHSVHKAAEDGVVELIINPVDRQRYFRSVVF